MAVVVPQIVAPCPPDGALGLAATVNVVALEVPTQPFASVTRAVYAPACVAMVEDEVAAERLTLSIYH